MASINLCFLFWLCCVVCGILDPQPGIEHRPLAVKAWSPNHWTTREFPPFSNCGHVMRRAYSLEKTLLLGKTEAGEEGGRGWDDWMASLIHAHEFEQTPEDNERQGSLACCSPWGRKDTIEWLNSNNNNFHNYLLEQFKLLITQANPTIITQKGMGEKQMTLKQGDG